MRMYKINVDSIPEKGINREYRVRGRGKLLVDSREYALRPGDAVLIQPNEVHQFSPYES
jgi:hypothetical protein